MRGHLRRLRGVVLLAAAASGCGPTAAVPRHHGLRESFFPLTPNSQWEYAVSRRAGSERFRFIATVKQDEFLAADGRSCRIVDERYTDVSGNVRFPVVYCTEGGFLHRVMSLEYRGDTLEDTGMRSGELKFLPTDLRLVDAWEGWTNAYRLPDGSGFAVRQLHRALPQPDSVEVPAGRFEGCVRVETTAIHSATATDGTWVGPSVVYYYSDWYAPGVGLVRTEQRNADAEVVATIELVRYRIGGEVAGP
jgi:hypothetical protein